MSDLVTRAFSSSLVSISSTGCFFHTPTLALSAKWSATRTKKKNSWNRYLTFPKFRVTVIFAQRCAKIKPIIFAHDGCAKIKTRETRFFQGVRKLKPICVLSSGQKHVQSQENNDRTTFKECAENYSFKSKKKYFYM